MEIGDYFQSQVKSSKINCKFTKRSFFIGPFNSSGVWDGVMGDVVAGKYPMSLNTWKWIIERQEILDFVPIVKENQVLTVIPKPPELDPGLFIRPFR